MVAEQKLLVETIPLVMDLDEASSGEKIVFRGRVGVVGAPTLNKRRYSEAVVRRELGKLGEAIKNRRLLGELDHPDDGRTRLTRVSHLITDWTVEGSELVARFEPLQTPNGKILEALGRAGVQVGASIRGWGSTRWNKDDGVEDVGEDYTMKTFDVVYEPAAEGAYPQMVAEAIEAARVAEEQMDLDTLKRDHPALYEEVVSEAKEAAKADAVCEASAESISVREQEIQSAVEENEQRLRSQFSAGVRRLAESLAEEARAHARSEAMSDPDVAGARVVIERIAGLVAPWTTDARIQEVLDEKEREVTALHAQVAEASMRLESATSRLEEMEKVALEAAYNVVLERDLRNETDETRNAVLALVDVGAVESKESLRETIGTILSQLVGEARGKAEPTQMKCQECGHKFKKKIGPNTVEVQCPKCKGYDTLPTDYFGEEVNRLQGDVNRLQGDVDRLQGELVQAESRVEQLTKVSSDALDLATKAAAEGYVAGVASRHPMGAMVATLGEAAVDVDHAKRLVEEFDRNSARSVQSAPDDLTEKIRRRFGRGKERDITEDTEGPAVRTQDRALPSIPGFNLDEYRRKVGLVG